MTDYNMMKFCPYCGSKIIPDAKFCIECGKDLSILNQYKSSNHTENKESKEITFESQKQEKIELENNTTIVDNNINENVPEKPKVKKSFSLLNKAKHTKTIKENNNFELIRPGSSHKAPIINTEKTVDIPKSEPPQNRDIQETLENNTPTQDTIEINTDGFNCPNCNKNMHLSTTSGFLSKNTYHYCTDCKLKFKENNDKLILEEEPEYSRMKNKLHLKGYTRQQWTEILHGDFTPEYKEEFSKWTADSIEQHSCPLCENRIVKYKGSGFNPSYYLICSRCGLTLKEQKNNQYTVYDCKDNDSPLWKYDKNPLTLDTIKRIIDTEESEQTRQIREERVKQTELKIRKHEEEVKQKENDLVAFAESLESGNPLLPVPSDTTIILKKNEVPIYKMSGVTLSEPRAVRTSSGGYGGMSVRVAKGVTLHSGRTASTSVSHDEIKLIDQGDLLVTNKRLIFLGSNRTTNIDLNKIISITSTSTSIQVQRSNKQKPEYFDNIISNETFTIDGRTHTVVMDGELFKKLLIGQIS